VIRRPAVERIPPSRAGSAELKLHLYILRSILASFAFALGAIVVLAVPGVAVSAVARLPGVDTGTLLLFMPLLLSEFIPYVVPVCFLLAVIFTFGRLEADGEWTAIQMAGVHPWRALAPGLVLALVLALSTLWLLSEELPKICRAQKQYQIDASRTLFQNMSPGRTEVQFGKYYLSALARDGGDFLDVVIVAPRAEGGPPHKLVADRAHFEFREKDVLIYLTRPHTISGSYELRSSHPVIRIDLSQIQGGSTASMRSTRYKESSQLRELLGTEDLTPEKRTNYRFEIQQRRASASICMVFLLLGVPTGLRFWRRRQLLAIAAGVGYALVYYVLSMRLGHVLVEHGVFEAELGAWVLPIVGVLVGGELCRRGLGPSGGPR
jgi:lipopolysaccharide export LptBFGC system permease protein LptF